MRVRLRLRLERDLAARLARSMRLSACAVRGFARVGSGLGSEAISIEECIELGLAEHDLGERTSRRRLRVGIEALAPGRSEGDYLTPHV